MIEFILAILLSVWPNQPGPMPVNNTGIIMTTADGDSADDSTDIGGEKGHIPPTP